MIYVLGVSLLLQYLAGVSLKSLNHNIAYSVEARVEMELEDLSDEFRREEGRLEDRRDPRDVGLSVSLESAGVSDSYEVRLCVICGDLSARAEK